MMLSTWGRAASVVLSLSSLAAYGDHPTATRPADSIPTTTASQLVAASGNYQSAHSVFGDSAVHDIGFAIDA